MIYKDIEKYIDKLYSYQNINMNKEQRNLYSRGKYYKLVRDVLKEIKNNKDCSCSEIRKILFYKSKIEEKIKEFVLVNKKVPGMLFSYGTKNYKETIVIGNKQEKTIDSSGKIITKKEKMTEDAIFDLASVTKLFTSLSILNLAENNYLNLNDCVKKYAPEFENLENVTIIDLLSFNIGLRTDKRIDNALDKEEAEKILFDIKKSENKKNKNPYTDMGAMILKYIIEKISNKSYYDFLKETILDSLNLKDTNVVIPKSKIERVVNNNLDVKIYKNNEIFINKKNTKGIVYDPKAQIMGQKEGNLSGHAGLFSSANDMTKLAKGIIKKKIITEKYINNLAINKTGKKYFENGKINYVQYFSLLCYSKNPRSIDSEVHSALSGRSFSSVGWTGSKFTVDTLNNIFLFASANRSHNRITYIGDKKSSLIKMDSKNNEYILNDNEKIYNASNYAVERDTEVIDYVTELLLKYKILEDFYEMVNEKVTYQERDITL